MLLPNTLNPVPVDPKGAERGGGDVDGVPAGEPNADGGKLSPLPNGEVPAALGGDAGETPPS